MGSELETRENTEKAKDLQKEILKPVTPNDNNNESTLTVIRKRTQKQDIVNRTDSQSKLSGRSRKRTYANLAFQMEPNAVARRNERERNRVRMVNDGFSSLRQHIPYFPEKKKLSKVETLRCAVAYIKHLQQLIEEDDALLNENDRQNFQSWVTAPQRL